MSAPAGTTFAPPLAPGWYERPDGGEPFAPAPPTPGPDDLLRAREVVAAHLPPTPLELSRGLSERFGRRVYVKLENCSPIRSFKARGPLVGLAAMSPEQLTRGVVAASTGNHAQGVALAAERFGSPATVVVPEGTEPAKARAIGLLGARLVVAGRTFNDAQRTAQELAEREGLTLVDDGEDPRLLAGAASLALELLEAEPAIDCIVVPVGAGNLIAGTLLGAELARPGVEVVGVQSAAASGACRSWLERAVVSAECATFTGGIATERAARLALGVMDRLLRRMALVTEDDLWQAIAVAYETTGFPVEGAAAATIAALERHGDRIPGERVALILSGGWIGAADLCRALSR